MQRRWDRHAIKAAVYRRGLTLDGLARRSGLEPSACRVALLRRHSAGEAAIAAALGVDPAVLWPERYASDRPISRMHRSRIPTASTSPITTPKLTLRRAK